MHKLFQLSVQLAGLIQLLPILLYFIQQPLLLLPQCLDQGRVFLSDSLQPIELGVQGLHLAGLISALL